MYSQVTDFIHDTFNTSEFIPLHIPRFQGNEKAYLNECIDSTFVSYVGKFVTQFEDMVCDYTGIGHAAAVVNGTSALHTALLLAGVKPGEEVITQALTFVATVNAIAYCGAQPLFVDVDRDTMGMSPQDLEDFLQKYTEINKDGECYNKQSGRRIAACMPMHTLGHPVRMDEILDICERYHLPVVEDAAESLGSKYKGRYTGGLGLVGAFSFNGNKTVTTGGGGMIVSNDKQIIEKAKHLTTTAKKPHRWEFYHDSVGFNYRMPNVNAAIGCAQMEVISSYVKNKRELAALYADFFAGQGIDFFTENTEVESNYWLNAVILKDLKERNAFLEYTNENGVMTRPLWKLMCDLEIYSGVQTTELKNSRWLSDRVVNIPSSVR